MSATLAPRPRRADHDCLRLTTAFLVFFLFTLRALAGQVSLAWNPSSDSRVIGYKVYYGTQSGSYTANQNAGNSTSTTVTGPTATGLTAGQTYYFVVRAYDSAGTESANSNQVSATIPAAAPTATISATPTSGTSGVAVTFTSSVTGASSYTWNFGDNGTSNVQNPPPHTYSCQTGTCTYNASLKATGAGGSVTSNTKTITVTASGGTPSQAPNGAIVSPSSNTSVATGTSVQFAGSGTGSNTPLSYSWDFGNGSTSTSQNPRVTFNSAKSNLVTLTVRDSKGVADPSPATVTINVVSGTAPPVANADSYTVVSGKTLTVASPGVLSNDTSPSGKTLTASLATNVASGTLSLASNGSFTYTPAAGFTGNVTFSYKASDGTTTSAAANVTITVTAAATTTSSGLVAAYSFNEGTGTTVNDSSGKGNKGTISNATWTNSGRFGKALSFNGTNAWVTVPDSSSLDLTTGMTLEAWVYAQGDPWAWRSILLKEHASAAAYYLETKDEIPVTSVIAAGSNRDLFAANGIPLNTWTHVAATYDGATQRLYVNGVQVATRTQTGQIQVSTGSLRIGGNSIWGEYFQGLIDEIRIYNRALSASEIKADMNSAVM